MKSLIPTLLTTIFLCITCNTNALGGMFEKRIITIFPGTNYMEIKDEEDILTTYRFKQEYSFFSTNNTVYLAVDNLGELLCEENIRVEWNDEKSTVSIFFDGQGYSSLEVEAKSGEYYILDRDKKVLIDVPIILKQGRLFIPLRPLLNALNYEDDCIIYNDTDSSVIINKSPSFKTDVITVTDMGTKKIDSSNIEFEALESVEEKFLYRMNIFDITDQEKIDAFCKLFTEDNIEIVDVAFRGAGQFNIDFNNGTAISFPESKFEYFYFTNNPSQIKQGYHKMYRVKYSLQKAVETFIATNGNYGYEVNWRFN